MRIRLIPMAAILAIAPALAVQTTYQSFFLLGILASVQIAFHINRKENIGATLIRSIAPSVLTTVSNDAQAPVIHDPLRIAEEGRPRFLFDRSFELFAL